MANHHDSMSLHWVRGEIQETLKQGQKALEAFAENRDDRSRLRFCLNHLHQVHGTLRMVELHGAALVAQEMEKLAEALLSENLNEEDPAISSLMQGILQLPNYLENLRSSEDDIPMTLLPLLNNLRAARGENFLSASSLFSPDLSPVRFEPSPRVDQRLQDEAVRNNVRKLYQMFQFARSGLERGVDIESHLDYLDKVIERLIKLCQKTPSGELWLAAGAFVDTLKSGHNEVGAATIAMLGELDQQLSKLLEQYECALSSPIPEDVFKNLLYYVARGAHADASRVNTVVQRYQLDRALTVENELEREGHPMGPAREAIQSVVGALNEELAQLKDQLDLFVRAHERRSADLEELLPGLRQVANTLSMLGQDSARQLVSDQADLLERMISADEFIDDGTLMDIAGALLYVESSASGMAERRGADDSPDGVSLRQLSQASNAVLRESRNALEQVKTAIVNFIASQWDREEIRPVPDLLYSIRGSLQLIPLERTGAILESAERFVRDALLNEHFTPDWNQLDTLADAITSIEYYLERLADGIQDNDAILTMAEQRLENLGFPAGEEPTWQLPEDASETEASEAESAAPPQPKESDADLLDDDILEIFVEEADEVLETIREHYPRYRTDQDDHEALSEVRRAFHTLKGSGRLVGATSIGELAWSVENLLNRILDGSIVPTESIFGLLDRVVDRLPGLIQEFREGNMAGDVTELMDEANALVEAHKPSATTDTVDADDVAHEPEEAPEEAASAETSEPDPDETETPAQEPETAPTPAATVDEAPPADEADEDSLIDDEILEIFIEEAEEVLETISEYLPRLLEQYDNSAALTEVRRAFHTLKGSGRMVEAQTIGELAWEVENALNRVIDGTIFMNEDLAQLLQDVHEAVPTLIEDFRQRRSASLDTVPLRKRASALARGEILDNQPMPQAEEPAPEPASPEAPAESGMTSGTAPELDPVLVEIFRSETTTHLQSLNDFLAQADGGDPVAYTDDLSRALHTLKGSAHTAGIDPIARVVAPMEKFIKKARAEAQEADGDVIELLRQTRDFVQQGLDQLDSSPQAELPETTTFLSALSDLAERYFPNDDTISERPSEATSTHTNLLQLFLNEGIELLLDADRILDSWLGDPTRTEDLDPLVESLGRLAETADSANVSHVSELAGALENLYYEARQSTESPGSTLEGLAREAHDALINLMDQLAAGLATESAATLVTRLNEQAADLRQSRSEAQEQAFNDQFGEHLDSFDRHLSDELELDEETGTGDKQASQPSPEPETDEKAAETASPAPEADQADSTGQSVDLDPDMADIFLEEARDLITSTGETLEQWRAQPDNTDPLRALRRDIHTLKGGASLAGISPISDLSHELENLLEGISEGYLSPDESACQLSAHAHDELAAMVDGIAESSRCQPAPELIRMLREFRDNAHQQGPVTEVPDVPDLEEEQAAEPEPEPEPETGDSGATGEASADFDPELAEIFLEEAHELIDTTAAALHDWVEDPGNTELAKTLQRDLHTLKGGARMAEISAIGNLAHCLEDLFERVAEGRLALGEDTGELLFACHDALARMVEQTSELRPCEDATHLVQRVEALLRGEQPLDQQEDTPAAQEQPDETVAADETASEPAETQNRAAAATDESSGDSELISIFLDEARDVEEAISQAMNNWQADPERDENIPALQGELHTLKGGARLSEMPAIAELADQWDSALASVIDGAGDGGQALTLSQKCHQALRDMLEALESGETPGLPADLFAEGRSEGTPGSQILLDDVDPEVLEIFLEEAGELSDSLDNTLDAWKRAGTDDNGEFTQQAQRALHTIKGGARLAELTQLGDKAHQFETLLTQLEQSGKAPGEQDWEQITRFHDEIISMVEQVQQAYRAKVNGEPVPSAPAPAPAPEPTTEAPEPAAESSEAPGEAQPQQTVEQDPGNRAREQRKAELARSAQETIRVNAQLVDDLVNLAGETSITRGRLEQQISDFSHTLDEMAATTERLREQLRRMEIETEAQILHRAEQEFGPEYTNEDFDPLEMDRYSAIQQLSRALSESASDLADLRETMNDKVRDAETLLLQQSRTNTELQEGLMKTRMVPFSSMVPRLRRIVRQISGELGKKTHLEINNAEGEMDRTVLERMVAPLEHMLRNAIDHGIEEEKVREQAGKPGTGHIHLNLAREGGEVVLRLVDDGAGIDIGKVREKAIRQNMLGEDEELTDREILQFILQPGFSTAASVTQVSGRGVGMDVVASEIKQLGGSLDIDSTYGEGTTFTVRLPFTVSVNRALMVNIGEDYFAIPLNTIEGIVRVSTYELEEYYQPDAPLYEYAGEQYRLQYLGALLNSDHQPKLQGQALPLPVILVRGAEQPMALQVDSLMGSREIVVKSLGPQFASVRGVSGATILGDGNVVVILDLPAMIRGDILAQRQRMLAAVETEETPREHRPTQVMVVDDSVTVRKVTSRLLERHGMEVLLAKDGLDAVGQLQDHRPDVVLLDIEMPRMDGFEVASFIRHDSNLQETPIVMITSRTGDKHRERAEAIGVNRYLGKPFQEKELLDTILEMAGVEAEQ